MFGSLEQTQNHIHYPNSKFTNIRNNMGKGSSGGGGSQHTTTSSHTSTTKSSKPTYGSSKCTGVAAWNADKEYKPKATVTYSEFLLCPS